MQLNNGIIILERNIFYDKELYWISKLILLVTVRCCQSTLKRYKHKFLHRNIFSLTKLAKTPIGYIDKQVLSLEKQREIWCE